MKYLSFLLFPLSVFAHDCTPLIADYMYPDRSPDYSRQLDEIRSEQQRLEQQQRQWMSDQEMRTIRIEQNQFLK